MSAAGKDFALAQGQYAALAIGRAALAGCCSIILGCTCSIDVQRGLRTVSDGGAATLVSVDQTVALEHRRIAAAFGQQAAFEGCVLVGGGRVDAGLELFFGDDVHAWAGKTVRALQLPVRAACGVTQDPGPA